MKSVYIVHRDSAEGPEVDVFTDGTLAQAWADYIGSKVTEEFIIDSGLLKDLKKSYQNEEEE